MDCILVKLTGVLTASVTVDIRIGYRFGDYLIPCLTLPAEMEQLIGLFGRWRLDYLKQHRRVTYINLLTSGRRNVSWPTWMNRCRNTLNGS